MALNSDDRTVIAGHGALPLELLVGVLVGLPLLLRGERCGALALA